jgi:hypothetical protein
MTSIINRTQITNNNSADYNGQVSRYGDVSWTQQYSGSDYDVMYQTLNATSATRIGGSSGIEFLSDMSSAGGVVFSSYSNGNYNLTGYSGLSGARNIGVESTTRNSSNAQADGFYNVVYEYAFSATDHDIKLFNTSTGVTTSVASSSANQSRPDIAGDFIVYEQQSATGQRDIYEYKISTGQTTLIAGAAKDEFNAHVSSNGNVIYQSQYSTNDSDIKFYNATTGQTQTLAAGSFNENSPQIAGNYAIWQAWDGNDYEIYRFDAATNRTVQVTNNSVDDRNAQVSENGMVVYEHQYSATDTDIYLFDGSTSMGVATSVRSESNPHINGSYVSWTGFDGNDTEIYRAQIAA